MNRLLQEMYREYDFSQSQIASSIIKEIREMVDQENFKAIDDMLISLDHSKAPSIMIISLARCTYSYRHSLSEWNDFILRSKKYFEEKAEMSKFYLRGLN